MRDLPQLYGDLIPIWHAFWILSKRRQIGFGVHGAIPMSEIEAYARIHGIDDLKEFSILIETMDEIYLDRMNPKAPPPK